MSITIGGVRVTLRFGAALLCALLPFLPGRLPPLLLGAIVLHEGGHLLYILLQRLPLAAVDCTLRGVKITLRGDACLSTGQSAALNLAGPLANLLAVGPVLWCDGTMQGKRAAAVLLAVALVTLVPCGNTDGAMALKCLFSRRVQRWVGVAVGLLCCGCALWQGMPWGIAMGLYFVAAAWWVTPT